MTRFYSQELTGKVWKQCLILFKLPLTSQDFLMLKKGKHRQDSFGVRPKPTSASLMDSHEPGSHPQSGNVSFGEILPLVHVNHQILENHDCQEHPTMEQNEVLRCCLSLGHVPCKRFYFWQYQIFKGLIKLKQQKVNIRKIILLEK